ncbi:class D sortase [Paenibacillus ginsengarvi]|uniref:Class D sortase n=1 Tax=Paenibacillus ginsengarvi TaxID=400777 RepID=A0A3B0C7K0_9BACL|nr:class D sortase [Paenibacillus ginsengarvi]RKN82033.1 class D sortase [Paenibacillus ginsengarvi]
MRWRVLSYSLIVLGLVVLVAPKWMEWRSDWEMNKLLREADHLVQPKGAIVDTSVISGYERVSNLLAQVSTRPEEDEPSVPAETEAAALPVPAAANEADVREAAPQAVADKPREKAIAVIEIGSIGVKLPVLEGATEANMSAAATHMTETAPLGEVGNAAIAAHRARTKGRLFNRLDEVKVGDSILIRTANATYEYTVYETLLVAPDDVSVLESDGKEKRLTLITCDPVVNATHRLIVHAKME